MLIAGNWKMNTTLDEATELAAGVREGANVAAGTTVRVAVCPPFVNLSAVAAAVAGSNVLVGAQNLHEAASGAYTGEVSAAMATAVGCSLAILGHSERRQYFGETDEKVNEKISAARGAGLIPIVCVGETLEEREAGKEEDVVGRQIAGGFDGVEPADDWMPVIAYEPVWAIGTGVTATPEQAQSMHRFIRSRITERFGSGIAGRMEILYGGSMNPSNAAELLAQPDIDGGLIGGASLKAADFTALIEAAIAASSD